MSSVFKFIVILPANLSDRSQPCLNDRQKNDQCMESKSKKRWLTQFESSEQIVARGQDQVEPGV